MMCIFLEGFSHLDGQLARRCEYQHLRLLGVRIQAGQQGQRKGGRLAGTGLGLAQHVTAFENRRNRSGLNR